MSTNEKSATCVELSKEGNVATIRFVTEQRVAIFSSRVLGELGTLVQQVAEEPHVRFVVLRGSGPVFLAGADLGEMVHFNEDQGHALTRHGHNVMNAIEALPQATIAAIAGHALGGGCELAMACDFRLMVKGARIGQPESRLGLTPAWGGTRRLPQLVGLARARRMMYSGAAVSAAEALEIGLVDEVVDSAEDLDAALARWFEALGAGSPTAVTRIKRAILHNDEMKQFGMCFSCYDAKEGMKAFLEKRPPAWAKPSD
ncbi:MAG: enoyl-CoA hydratase/isomerase family protein [Planctomycetes bacterium]|nr:enoyl-CoA hydratase/isomerase family protein [Planctomycetota bacterium]